MTSRSATADTEPAPVPREHVRRALAPYLALAPGRALADFLIDYACYGAAIAGVLFAPWLAAKILCSLVAGIKIANLGTLGHDAAHGNLFRRRWQNRLVGVLSFLPGLYNFRLWLYDHHNIHHIVTNGEHWDAWKPFSKAEYDALPRFRRWREHLYRMPFGLGFAPYYIIERWWVMRFFPRASFLPARFMASAWWYFALLVVYLGGFLALLACAPLYSSTGTATALILGFALPFYVWQTLFSFSSLVNHTHPDIPWFDGPIDRKGTVPMEQISLHLAFPYWFALFVHFVYEHPVHHVMPRIPYHRLWAAQHHLKEIAPHDSVRQDFSFAWLNDMLRRCKLYDYERNRWLDFEGRPTAASPLSAARRAAVARGRGMKEAPRGTLVAAAE
jgi:omega-6 fatty acid desaturase (delta-12 desaturase)